MATSREAELANLWQALAANEGGIQRVFDSAYLGMTPDDMREVFVSEVRRRGIEEKVSGAAFVVGEGGVGPKLRLMKKPLEEGDMWGMDFQFQVGGLYSDIGRYSVFGEPSADLRTRHQSVLDTQQMIAESIKPGRPIREAFEKIPAGCKWTIEVHRVAGGLHMDPAFSSAKSENHLDYVVPVGIVLCVEIWAGFDGGIEDEYLVAEDGLKRLTTLPRALVNTARKQ